MLPLILLGFLTCPFATCSRSVVIWMNDLAVVLLLFGNLMYSAHFKPVAQDEVKNAVAKIAQRGGHKTSSHAHSNTPFGNSASGFHSSEGATVQASGGVRFQDNDGAMDHSSKAGQKKPQDVVRSKDSWAGANMSPWEADAEDDPSNTVSDFEDEDADPSAKNFEKPTDVLSTSDTWAGGTFSQVEQTDRTEEAGVKHISGTSAHTSHTGGSKRGELPPARLPEKKPSHMSYAQDRITRIRGEHALVMAEKRSRSNGSLSNSGRRKGSR